MPVLRNLQTFLRKENLKNKRNRLHLEAKTLAYEEAKEDAVVQIIVKRRKSSLPPKSLPSKLDKNSYANNNNKWHDIETRKFRLFHKPCIAPFAKSARADADNFSIHYLYQFISFFIEKEDDTKNRQNFFLQNASEFPFYNRTRGVAERRISACTIIPLHSVVNRRANDVTRECCIGRDIMMMIQV